MNGEFSTIDLLIKLGFERRANELTEHSVHYRFGHLDLKALEAVNRFFVDVVFLSGVAKTARQMGLVEQQIPAKLSSTTEAAAWVSYALKDYRHFVEPAPEWFTAGEQAWDFIPWVREQREAEKRLEAWRKRTQCRIDREEARLLRKRIRKALAGLDRESDMTVEFDGRVLSIEVGDDVHQVVARGTKWPSAYRAQVSPETELPARFKEPSVTLSIWEGGLLMDEARLGRCKATT